MRRRLATFGLAAMWVGLACSGDESQGPAAQPAPGWIRVVLTHTPHADDGGMLFTVRGGAVDSVRSAAYAFTDVRRSATERSVLVVGNLVEGTLVEILVPNVALASDYVVSPVQVAASTTYAQRVITDYSFGVAAP